MRSLCLTIRDLSVSDIPKALEIERQSFTDAQWDEKAFLAYECKIAEVSGAVAGFLICRKLLDRTAGGPGEREILNLAVGPEWRRQGIARALMAAELKTNDIYYLEVRESNVAAQLLYRACGFVEIGRRPDYYHNPAEAAIVMRHE